MTKTSQPKASRIVARRRELPPPVFLGFGAKAVVRVAGAAAGMPKEICSFSGCRARWPTGWSDHPFQAPRLNRAGLVNREAQAIRRSSQLSQRNRRLYAFEAIPVLFTKRGAQRLAPSALLESLDWLEPLPPAPRRLTYERLGYDVVACHPHAPWGCSPLSCNEFAVPGIRPNRWYLLDGLEDAVIYARACGREEPEPGPYLIVGVFRKLPAS